MAFKTPEEVALSKARSDLEALVPATSDNDHRSANGVKRVFGVLEQAPRKMGGATLAGDSPRIVVFRAIEPGRDKAMRGIFTIPEHELAGGFGFESFQDRLDGIQAGDEISMSGRWSKHRWDDDGKTREAWQFNVERFEKGDVSISEMNDIGEKRLAEQRAYIEAEAARLGVKSDSIPDKDQNQSISYTSGNIVDDKAQVLVNTVNAQLSPSGRGVMGKGVALEFAKRYPEILEDYENAIRSGELKAGRALLFDLPDGRKWAALATKDHWQDKSKMEWVDSGLKELGEKLRAEGFSSVAITPPGCGNGGLDWKKVEPLVHLHLQGVAVSLYAKPSGAMDNGREAVRTPATDTAKSRALAALGGEKEQPKTWSKQDLLAAIPQLFSNPHGAYKAYAGIGSRETPIDVAEDMKMTAALLEQRGFTMRSGGADRSKGVQPPGTKSADISFEAGIADPKMKEIFIPWKGFGGSKDGILLDRSVEGKAREIAAAAHPSWDSCSDGAKSLHTRNVSQIFGPKLDTPSAFVICWTKGGAFSHTGPNGTTRDDGGTGQAIRIASMNGVPVLNMKDPDIRAAVMRELSVGLSADKEVSQMHTSADHRLSRGEKEFDLTPPATRSRAKDDVVFFCKVRDPFGNLSNMANTPFEVNGVRWASSEAYYQAMRFPHLPDLQEQIRKQSNGYTAKVLAHENKHLTRPDWEEVKHHAMAHAITMKLTNEAFREDLIAAQGKDIVELSVKDPHWGAQPKGDRLVGQDMLGSLLTQLNEGARMYEAPPGTSMPGMDRSTGMDEGDLPSPTMRASMYFNFGNQAREGMKSSSTFEAIQNGERTSTTRFPSWGSLEKWESLEPGSVVRFYSDKEMRGESVDVVITGTNRINLAAASKEDIASWSQSEGWSEAAGRDFGKRYGEGVQIRYALPGTPEADAALGKIKSPEVMRAASSPEREETISPRAMKPAARAAAMSSKDKWLAALG